MSRAFNTKISGDQLTVEARSTTGTGGITTNSDGALAADWAVVPDKSSVDAAMSTEVAARASVDTVLTTRISTEEVARDSADTAAAGVVSVEVSNRTVADASIVTKLDAEQNLRLVADSSIVVSLSSEVSGRVASGNETNASLSVETSIRISTDAALVAADSTEISIRTSSDVALGGRVDEEQSVRASADVVIVASVSTESSSRVVGDSSLATRLSTVEAGLVSGVLWKTSYNTLSDLTDAMVAISSPVSGWAFYDKAGNDGYVIVPEEGGDLTITGWVGFSLIKIADFKEIQGIQSVLVAADSAEAGTRASADTSLTARISDEEVARLNGSSSIVAHANDEISARIAGDSSLAVRLDDTLTATGSADTSLTARISTEEVARGSGDASVVVLLSGEISTRTSADSSLATRLGAEEVSRGNGDSSIVVVQVAAESTRLSADQSIVTGHAIKKFMARIGVGTFGATAAATNINLDTVEPGYMSAAFHFGADVVDLNFGENAFNGKAAMPTNLEIYINGVKLRPATEAGKIKKFIDGDTISFSGLNGDFVFYKNHGNGVTGVAFAFDLKAGDELCVQYFND
jgi:hypothetical protein